MINYECKIGIALIREFVDSDLIFIKNVDLKGYDYPWSDDQWNSVKSKVYVAVIEYRTVGFICVNLYKDVLQITRLSVTPSYRRVRIGSALLHFIIHKFQQEEYVTTVVTEYQEAGRQFLEYHNFSLACIVENLPLAGGRGKGYVYRGKII